MFVRTITIDNWYKNMNNEEVVENPCWKIIEQYIHSLDGQVRTLITLEHSEDVYMAIGGGEKGVYIAYISKEDQFFSLVNHDTSVYTEELVVGGQAGDYPKEMYVSIEEIMSAAKVFYENGGISSSLQWSKD